MKVRILTAIVAGGIIVASLNAPWTFPLLLISWMVLGIGLHELGELLKWGAKSMVAAWLASLALLAACLWWPYGSLPLMGALLGSLALGSVSLFLRRPDQPHPLAFLGVLWLVAPVMAFLCLHGWNGGAAPNPVTLMFLCVWAGDTAALLVGKSLGRTKLAPSLSPGKTWEGFGGGLAASLAAGAGFAGLFGISPLTGLAFGGLVGVLGQAGDLFESFMKRRVGVKDSGGFFPGHGGVLDRIDSMLMASIPACLALLLMRPEAFHVKQLWTQLLR